MDDGPVEPKTMSSPLVKALAVVGVAIVLGAFVWIVIWIGRGVATVAPEIKSSWRDVGKMRAADAAQVVAETKMGEAYKGSITLELAVTGEKNADSSYTAVITGKILNSGARMVNRVTANASFLEAGGKTAADKREIILVDATDLSARPDQAIPSGGTADVRVTSNDVSRKWDGKTFGYSLGSVRVDLSGQQ